MVALDKCWFSRSPSKFNVALARITTSLLYRPRNWVGFVMPNGEIYDLKNHDENMSVWMNSKEWGIDFKVDDIRYGGVNIWWRFAPWRRRLLNVAKATSNSPWIRKWGYIDE